MSLHITDLPDEILLEIFTWLDVKDVVSASQTCHRVHDICEDDDLWRHLCLVHYEMNELPSDTATWKQLYQNCTQLFQYSGVYYMDRLQQFKIVFQEKRVEMLFGASSQEAFVRNGRNLERVLPIIPESPFIFTCLVPNPSNVGASVKNTRMYIEMEPKSLTATVYHVTEKDMYHCCGSLVKNEFQLTPSVPLPEIFSPTFQQVSPTLRPTFVRRADDSRAPEEQCATRPRSDIEAEIQQQIQYWKARAHTI